jgi:hypothetical protein
VTRDDDDDDNNTNNKIIIQIIIIIIIIIEKNEMGGAYSAYGEGRGVYRVLVGKP